MNDRKSLEEILYLCGFVFLGAGILMGCLYFALMKFFPGGEAICVFHALTGLYCPGCGGTRAVRALVHGQVIKSFRYHPIVLYGGVMYVLFMGSHTLAKLKIGHVRGMRYRNLYLYIALAIVLINWIVKNILLIRFHMPMV